VADNQMASSRPYAVVRIDGLKPSERRAIIFLVNDGEPNAATTFDALKEKQKREVLTRFDFWISGGVHDKFFHGWPNVPEYKQCFVFKWKHRSQNHRLYGFLCHPRPRTHPRFHVCVLFSHATKNTWETDPRELDGANELRNNLQVIAVIQEYFAG
jgi:hypothetical protein